MMQKYWIVGGDASRFWSREASAYVTSLPDGWFATADEALAAGQDIDDLRVPTRIASEQDLTDVLASYGQPGPVLTTGDYADAIQAHVDAVAKARSYAHGVALASYVTSTIPVWAAEAQAFLAWRDAIWVYAHTELAKVLAAEREQPTVAAFIAELPTIEWPA